MRVFAPRPLGLARPPLPRRARPTVRTAAQPASTQSDAEKFVAGLAASDASSAAPAALAIDASSLEAQASELKAKVRVCGKGGSRERASML